MIDCGSASGAGDDVSDNSADDKVGVEVGAEDNTSVTSVGSGVAAFGISSDTGVDSFGTSVGGGVDALGISVSTGVAALSKFPERPVFGIDASVTSGAFALPVAAAAICSLVPDSDEIFPLF